MNDYPGMKIGYWLLGSATIATGLLLLGSCPGTRSGSSITVSIDAAHARVTAPALWSPVAWPGTTTTELLRTEQTATGELHEGRVLIQVEERVDHAEAIERLGQISAEAPGATFRLIDGWPALQRRRVVEVAPPSTADAEAGPPEYAVLVTTAVAVRDLVIRVEGSVRDGATAVEAEVTALGQSLTFAARPAAIASQADLKRLRDTPPRLLGLPAAAPRPPAPLGPTPAPPGPTPGTPTPAGGSSGELEVAASADGRQVVVAGQSTSTFFSTDGGLTFSSSRLGLPPGFGNQGDPSIALAPSGRFYVAFLGMPPGGGCTASVLASPPGNAASFGLVTAAASCPGSGNPQCFPDQEHIAADPNPTSKGGDQLYVVWRHFTPQFGGNCPTRNLNFPTPTIACSTDGGASWTSGVPIAGGDFPRVTVGVDGAVWVVQRNGGSVAISKLSSCERGLTMQRGFPKNLVAVADPVCPIAGLDRCEAGPISSATAAVDKTDPNHVYVAFASSTSNANDDIRVVDTSDGFATWPANQRMVTVNGPAMGRRFLPWTCTLGSSLQVGWYDRRAAAPGSDDLTAYFRNSASLVGGALVAGGEVNVSVNSDPQCAPGFPCGERNLGDADSCPTRQFDGLCNNATSNGSLTPCDQDSPSCPAGEVCVANGGNTGCPKYGDYNGIACAAGHVFAAWASATAPPGALPPSGIGVFVDALACGGLGQVCCSKSSCGSGLSCTEGTCKGAACGAPGQPCCGGDSCDPGAGCAAKTCVTCPPPPRTLVDTVVNSGTDCGGTAHDFDLGPATCDPGFALGACSATLTSLANGSTCSATPLGGCRCRVHLTSPADCSKWAACRGIVSEIPVPPPPFGCPGGPTCGGAGEACCSGAAPCHAGFSCSGGTCAPTPCGAEGEACCASGSACSSGLDCTGGTCTLVSCGAAGELCCPGNRCDPHTTCSSGSCVACPSATLSLADTTAHNGADCGGTSHDYFFGAASCDAGFVLGTCSATLSSQANGSTCSAVPAGGCRCKVTVTTPADCTKWADCHVLVDETPAPGCP